MEEINRLLGTGAAALRRAAMDDHAKNYILNSDVLYPLFSKAAKRYVAGENLSDAVACAIGFSRQGLGTSIEFMGENVRDEEEANLAAAEFFSICDHIEASGLNSTVSLDLSHIGLSLSRALCEKHLEQICTKAMQFGIEVMISAEDTSKTDAVLETYLRMAGRFENLGITLQTYLHRSKDDMQAIARLPNRIRLVKGAFQASAGQSLPRGDKLNETYLAYLDFLLGTRHRCSIATHDHLIQQEAVRLIAKHQTPSDLYEFESLLGICSEQLLDLLHAGHPAKMYIVYGKEWYLYLCNRIAEHPLSLFLAIDDVMQH